MKEIKIKHIDTPGLVKIVFDYSFDIGLMDMYFPVVVTSIEDMGMVKITRLEGVQTYDKGKVLREDKSNGKKKIVKIELPDDKKDKPEIVGFEKENIPAFHHVIGEKGVSSYPIRSICATCLVYQEWSKPLSFLSNNA